MAPIRVIQKYQIMKHVGFDDVLKKVKDVKSDGKSEEGENVILQARLSKRLLEWLHWSLKHVSRRNRPLWEKDNYYQRLLETTRLLGRQLRQADMAFGGNVNGVCDVPDQEKQTLPHQRDIVETSESE